MTTVATFAKSDPDRTALIFGNGEFRESYGELEARSRRIAHALRGAGLHPGDSIAALLPNHDQFFDLYWACHRTGLYFTPVNWHLQRDEVEYIVDNCDARAFFCAGELAEVAAAIPRGRLITRVALGGEIPGFVSFEEWIDDAPADAPLEDEREGSVMLYSSGTTGRPKGVRRALPDLPAGHPSTAPAAMSGLFGMNRDTVYLSPAPLYHAAPIGFTASQMRLGSTAVVMRRFDPEEALQIIQDQRVTASQWVPTHFKRLLMLPEDVRAQYDLQSLRTAVHAAAPCPIPVKQAMIDWWGADVILEYYAGTEGGGTLIRGDEWLLHKGSVGRHWAGGTVHVLDEDGQEIDEPEREGAIYFEAPPDPSARFRYHKDEEKTESTYRDNLFTLGDIGYKDADDYLYLTDRQSNMIISGGVNIYPQETESHLITHPLVADCAVIGVPNEEMGEEVKAVVVPVNESESGTELEASLIAFCRDHLAHYKCPRTIDFATEVPRTETGKMAKRKLRARYWEGRDSRLV